MTALATIITDAAYAAQILGADQTMEAADAQLMLRIFKRMMDSWSNEKSMVYVNFSPSFTMTAGQNAYSTSLFSTGRPIAINSMTVNLSSIDYPVDIIDQQTWNAIPYKPVQAIPNQCFYDSTYPNGTMYFCPTPYAPFLCTADVQYPLVGSNLTLATDLSLPEGYEAAMIAGLAVAAWGSFKQGNPSQQMLQDRTDTRAVLKRNNYSPLEMVTPFDSDSDISNGFLYKGF